MLYIDIPLRVNGKVSGTLNGIRLEELDLQCYVVTNDGRTYTAISKVPMELGYDMQSLNVLGTTLGWLFAKPIKSSKNGYELTGSCPPLINKNQKLKHKFLLKYRWRL
jgi:nidogen (entactin)